ncbi:hypothetical protein [Alcanivorax sp. S71-1-4]|jgi:hypothetical protein|uniref:hypothetical protein n=1 Tax=Alcanivorax sp. S71-1-4 TaxID=1177159 RepID=UPI00135CE1AF|nr:hypothetical protein [Alcanivorax sp. S71-1-4]
MPASNALMLMLATAGVILLNIGYHKRQQNSGLTMLLLGVICMTIVIGYGIYVALHG